MVFLGMLRHSLVLALTASVLSAQEVPAPPAGGTRRPPRHLRVLAVGESPPYRQEVRDGVRYEMPPPPGSAKAPLRIARGLSWMSVRSEPDGDADQQVISCR